MSVYCIGVIEPFPCERVTTITRGDTARIGLTDTYVPDLCPLTLAWDDDFETGDALAVNYTEIDSALTANGAGVGGSWGVTSSGDAVNQYNCGFNFTLPARAGRCGAVQFTVDHAASTDNGFGASLFEIRESEGDTVAVSLYHGIGSSTDRSHLQLFDADLNIVGCSTSITPGTFQVVRMDWQLSTISVCSTANQDGWVKVKVDGDLKIDATNLPLFVSTGVGDNNWWDRVRLGPMGHGDDLFIWTT